MVETCDICAENFNKSNRMIVKCHCGFECCRKCVKTDFLSKIEEPSCMSCKEQFNRNFLIDNFEKSFLNKEYKKHREEVLLQKELALLPATQIHSERFIRDKIYKKKRKELTNKIAEIRKEIFELDESLTIEEEDCFENDLKERKEFIRHCPKNNCKGFLSSSLKCSICLNWACSKCREVIGSKKDSEHTCNPEILENIDCLKKDTKPCPKCSSPIFKVNGCNQIYCIECNTAFDWISLKIETGIIHNPEYFEQMARNKKGIIPRNPNDILCGREIDYFFLCEIKNKMIKNNLKIIHKKNMIKICEFIIHVRFYEINRFDTNINLNLDLRIKYMTNDIDEIKFKKELQKKDKKNLKNNEIKNVLYLYVSCMTDILYKFDNNVIEENYEETILEIKELERITNNIFSKIGNDFSSKIYFIKDNKLF